MSLLVRVVRSLSRSDPWRRSPGTGREGLTLPQNPLGEELPRLESLEIAQIAANTAVDRKADDVLILDVAALTTVCDHFVICSAPTRVQTKDIVQKIEDALEDVGVRKLRVQGRDEGSWILLDYGSVVVHVFLRQERQFYDLEGRWSESKVVFDSNSAQAPSQKRA